MRVKTPTDCIRPSCARLLPKGGLSLVELLIALTLLSLISLTIGNFVMRGNAFVLSLSNLQRETVEVQQLLFDLRKDLRKGAYISDNSHSGRLEYTTTDDGGNTVKKIYQIYTTGSNQYLQLSTDNGSTWGSPYHISPYTKYQLTGSPRFLYVGTSNNCTAFTDNNGNGVYQPGTANGDGTYTAGADSESVGTSVSCPFSAGQPLHRPSEANRIDLNGFQFSTQQGVPIATRTLPTDFMIAVSPGYVRSTSTPLPSPAVKDPPLVQSFATNTANSLYTTAFTVKGVTLDPSHNHIILVGANSGNNTIFKADRNGVLIGAGMVVNDGSASTFDFDSTALEDDNKTLLALDATNKKVYRYDLSGTPTLSPSTTLNMGSPTNRINTPKSIAYDPNATGNFYVTGVDPSTSTWKIFEFSKTSSNAAATNSWSLPAAIDTTHPPGGMAIEPVTGDFLVVRNYVNNSGSSSSIDIYRIPRSGTTTSFSINIYDLGDTTTTGTSGNFGFAYEPKTNRIFLTDANTNKVYEVVPSTIISTHS